MAIFGHFWPFSRIKKGQACTITMKTCPFCRDLLIDTSHAHVCMISDSINEILPKMAIFGTFWPFYAIFHSTVWSRGKKNVLIMFVLWRPVDRYATWMCRCTCSNYYSHYLINKKMAFLHPVFLAFLEK